MDLAEATYITQSRRLLTSIIGFAEWLADPCNGLSEAKRLEYAEIIFAAGTALNERFEKRHGLVTYAGRFSARPDDKPA